MPRYFMNNGVYFETLTDVLLADLPVGTAEAPARPVGPDYQFQNSQWVIVTPTLAEKMAAAQMPRWRIMRALRDLKIDGTIKVGGEEAARSFVLNAIAAIDPPHASDEWAALSTVPRDPAIWPHLYAAVLAVKTGNTATTDAFLDALFARAATY